MSNRAQAAASQVATSKEQEAAALLNLTLQTNASLLELKDLQLRDLPPAFAQLRSMKLLPQFQTINLSRNCFSTIPRDLLDFSSLRELILDENRLISLPPEVGQMTQLRKLSLKRNSISELPPEIARMIRALSEGFSQSNLEELDLTGNQLATLPAEMLQMSALSLLVLVGNPLLRYFPRIIAKKTGTTVKIDGPLIIPPEIASLPAPDILQYLGDLDRLKLPVDLRSHWIPDETAPNCNLCNAHFTMTFRRHHCRICGRCVCKECASQSIPIPLFHVREALRVCKKCHTELNGGVFSPSLAANKKGNRPPRPVSQTPAKMKPKIYELSEEERRLPPAERATRLRTLLRTLEDDLAHAYKTQKGLENLVAFYANDPVAQKKSAVELDQAAQKVSTLVAAHVNLLKSLSEVAPETASASKWVECTAADGKKFYYDRDTAEVTFQRPADLASAQSSASAEKSEAKAEATAAPEVQYPQARVLYNYKGQSSTELSCKAGDIVLIGDKSNPEWWYAYLGGQAGYVPATYVQLL